MSRERHQRGWVEETGKRVAKWKGHYFVYERKLDGEETRKHRAPILGLKAEMKKWEAEKRLQEIIDKETAGAAVHPSPEHTLAWFWSQRYRPLKEPTWKKSSAPKTVFFIGHYVVSPFSKTHPS